MVQLPAGPVLVVGLGGLGCPISLSLAQAGVRELTLVDPDVVDASNLHRQPWHHPADLGRPKVDSAREKLLAAFPHLAVRAEVRAVGEDSVEALMRAHALSIDATDGVATKFLLSDAAVAAGTPHVYGGVVRFEGLAMKIAPGGPCLRCLFEAPPADAPTCAQIGVLGSMAGLLGGVMAHLALEAPEADGTARLEVVDGLSLAFRGVTVRRRPDCRACAGAGRAEPPAG